MSSEPQQDSASEQLSAEEILRLCEETILQYKEELRRQRRLLDVVRKPQLQQVHHAIGMLIPPICKRKDPRLLH